MRRTFELWFRDLPIHDPMQRRQALVMQAIIMIVLCICLAGLVLAPLTMRGNMVPLAAYTLLLVLMLAALRMLRQGRFSASVVTVVMSLIITIGLSLVAVGIAQSESVVMSLIAPIVVAGMTLGRRGLLATMGVALAFVVGVAALSAAGSPLVGFVPNRQVGPLPWASTLTLVICGVTLLLDRFRLVLRDALTEALERQRELESLQAGLERTVSERTASLAAALREGELREARLEQALSDLQASRSAIRELSAPVIPVLSGVLVVPLVGALDEQRASDFAQNLLQSVARQRARYAIIDVTGVPLVDTHVAKTLIGTASAIRLLGAQTLLVGIRPEVAQTLVSLGVELGGIPTYADLQEAIVSLQARIAAQSPGGGRGEGRTNPI
jgi:rsbT co-antagonist protein RsbR